MGVDLFFVLSGYLIGLQVFSARRHSQASFLTRCSTFWIKRWTRTVPLYAVVLFTYVVIKPRVFHAPFAGSFNWRWAFFLQNYGPIRDFGQSWSLCIEEQFYFVFPLIVFSAAFLPRAIWIAPVFLSTAVRLSLAIHLSDPLTGQVHLTPEAYLAMFRFPTLSMLDAISVGVFLAAYRDIWAAWPRSFRIVCAPIGATTVLMVAAFSGEFPQNPLRIGLMYTALALGFGALLVAAERQHEMIRGFSFVRWIALCSYSAYLWHELFTRFFDRYLHGHHWSLQLAGYLTAVFLFSMGSYEWIEKPGLRLRNRIFRRLVHRM